MRHTSQRWKQIEILFHDVFALPPEERSGFLRRQCGDDNELREEVETLLKSADQPMDFLKEPVVNAARALTNGPEANLISAGEFLGHYEIISFLGAGGMGQVYLARDTILKRKAAVKVLSPALASNARWLRRLEHEARAASALNHPNILTIYGFGNVDGVHFIASEYVEGQTLRHKLADGKLTVEDAIEIAMQIAKALDAASASGIVHCDIKPENVVIRPDGVVKVLDFGIAKLCDAGRGATPSTLALSLTIGQAGQIIGSARYMSPEQARGQEVDPRSDIFSLGVILYEMLAGNAPFDGQTVSDVIAEILKSTPQDLHVILPEVPLELQRVVGKAMYKDREARYQSAKEMLADLQEFLQQSRLHAGALPASAAKRDQAHEQRHPPLGGLRTGAATSSQDTQIAPPLRQGAARWLAISLVLTAAVLCAVFLWAHSRKSRTTGTPVATRRLAILPFQNLRQDASLNYLGFSLADALITKMSSVGSLVVRPSTAVERYRNRSVDPQTVGNELQVDTLLTSGFIKDGDDLRITTQLVDLKQNRILWRDSFDVRFDDLLAVQDRVAGEIVKGMELSLSPAEAQDLNHGRPVNAKAYECYLRGIDLYSLNNFSAAIAMLEESASLDPNYAPTWANLGRAYTTSATLQLGGRQQYDKAQAAYEKAIALDPSLVEARVYMANMLTDTGRVEQAVPLLRSALATSPNDAELHWELGYAYRFAGMLQESVAECEKARRLDPQVKLNSSEVNSYLYLGEYEKFLESLPDDHSAYVLFYRGLGEYYERHLDLASKDFNMAYGLEPSLLPARIGKALSETTAGDRADALRLLRQTEDEMEERGVSDAESMFKIAQAYAVLGDKPASLHALSHTVEGGFFCNMCLVSDPLLVSIRSEPEYLKLVQEAQQRQGQFKTRFF